MTTLASCICRSDGLLGTLTLGLNKVLRWEPADFIKDPKEVHVADVSKLRRDGGKRLVIEKYDGQRIIFAASAEDEAKLEKVSQRLEQMHRMSFNISNKKSKVQQILNNSSLISYWNDSDKRYQGKESTSSISNSTMRAKSHSSFEQNLMQGNPFPPANPFLQEGGQDCFGQDTTSSNMMDSNPFGDDDDAEVDFLRSSLSNDNNFYISPVSPTSDAWVDSTMPFPSLFTSSYNSNYDADVRDKYPSAKSDRQAQCFYAHKSTSSSSNNMDFLNSSTSNGHGASYSFPQNNADTSLSSSHELKQEGRGLFQPNVSLPMDQNNSFQTSDDANNYRKKGHFPPESTRTSHSKSFRDGDDDWEDDAEEDIHRRERHNEEATEELSEDDQDVSELEDDYVTRGPASEECTSSGIMLNARVLVNGKRATLRYCGMVHFDAGEWCGVEFDEMYGSHDGTVSGVRYFSCPENHGKFVPMRKVKPTKEMSISTQYGLRVPLILPRPEWEDDVQSCPFCNRSFTTRRRHHHCRCCGRVCCNSCSQHERHLPFLNYVTMERVCVKCEPLSVLVWHASGAIIHDKKIVMGDLLLEQLHLRTKAAHTLVEMSQKSAQQQQLIDFMPALAVIINLCLSPFDDLQACGVSALKNLSENEACRGTLVALGIFRCLTNVLKTNSDGKTFSAALLIVFNIIKEAQQFCGEAIQSGLLFAVIQLMSEAVGKAQGRCSLIFKHLAKSQKSTHLIIEDEHSLRTILSAAPRMKDNPQAQEPLLCGLAFLSNDPSTLPKLNEIHVLMSYVLSSMVSDLVTLSTSGSGQDRTYRQRSLVHIACFLANLSASSQLGNFSSLRYTDDLTRIYNIRATLPELRLHTTRGLLNLCRHERCSRLLVRSAEKFALPLSTVAARTLKLYILKALRNITSFPDNVDNLRVAVADYIDDLHRIAQATTDRELSEEACTLLLMLGFDVMTERRRYTPQMDLDEDAGVCEAIVSPPCYFPDSSEDEITKSSSDNVFQPYVPEKHKKESRGAVIADRLLMVMNDNQKQAAKYQELLQRAKDAKQDYIVELTQARFDSTTERISALDQQIVSLKALFATLDG
eukprot:m.75828 g.75828  ORF g.75828 m.75828 type:complete len:1087 (-) comp8497_c0_seq1:22-3282(-)